jgi:hypothetical protein
MIADTNGGPQEPGWWQASDGQWYPPHTHPNYQPPPTEPVTQTTSQRSAPRHDVNAVLRRLIKRPEGIVGLLVGFVVGMSSLGSNPVAAPIAAIVGFGIGYGFIWVFRRLWEQKTWPNTPPYARPVSRSGSRAQLREDSNAHFFRDRGGFLFTKRYFFVATGTPPYQVNTEFYDWAAGNQRKSPVSIGSAYRRTHWWFEDQFYWENADYQERDVLALVRDRERRRQRSLDRAHDLLNSEQSPGPRRGAITRDMRRLVWDRDGGACTECGSTFDLQYDHIIPVAMGGATTAENLQLLCSDCNRRKWDSL